MQTPDAPVSLADLSAAGIRLRPEEAVALVRELALQVTRGDIPGVPSAHVIRLSATGRLSVEGPVGAGGPSVVRAAQLLDSLLPAADGASPTRVPGALKLVLARGLRTLDLPPFRSLDDFAEALARFAAADPSAVVAGLVGRWAAAIAARPAEEQSAQSGAQSPQAAQVEPFTPVENAPVRAAAPPLALTVSDIRRARRATGMSLGQVAERSQISLGLLRQLEWGYLVNWPSEPHGRRLLTRYARAAGLDEQLVIATIMPLIEQVASLRALFATRRAPAERAEPAGTGPVGLADTPLQSTVAVSHSRPVKRIARRSGARAFTAAAALAILALAPAWWILTTAPPEVWPPAAHAPAQPEISAPATPSEPDSADQQILASQPVSSATPEVEPADTSAAAHVPSPEDTPGAGTPVFHAAEAVDTTARRPAASIDDARAMARDNGPRTGSSVPDPVGTAMFHASAAAEGPAAVGASGMNGAASVLRVTRIVGDAANNSHVRPSPDGRHIAFDSDRDGERGVYIADADGQNVRRVSPDGFAAMPSWSPDGTTLAFVRSEAGRPDVWNLWTLELATGALRQITRHGEGQPRGGSWFSTGDRIVYSLGDRLVIHDLNSGRERVYASPKKGRHVRTPVASPDGRRVVFQVHQDGAWLLDVADGSMQRVLDDPTADAYAWSPDGKQLAYHSERSGGWGVWMMAPR